MLQKKKIFQLVRLFSSIITKSENFIISQIKYCLMKEDSWMENFTIIR